MLLSVFLVVLRSLLSPLLLKVVLWRHEIKYICLLDLVNTIKARQPGLVLSEQD